MKAIFKLLGTGAGPGTPSFFCDCSGCREARENSACARTRSGALLSTSQQKVLIDTPPDLRIQLLREQPDCIDAVLLTHWHYDHFGGIGELEYYVKLRRKAPIDLYLPPSALESFSAAFPALEEVFHVRTWTFGQSLKFDELCVTPLPAVHGIETAGFMVESAERRLAYFPDTAGLPELSALRVQGVDWLICDATFFGENWFPDVHMSVPEAIELGRKVQANHTVLTHLSMHYSQPVTVQELTAVIAPYPGAMVAFDGMSFEF